MPDYSKVDTEKKLTKVLLDLVAEFFDEDAPVHPGAIAIVDSEEITAEALLRWIRLGKRPEPLAKLSRSHCMDCNAVRTRREEDCTCRA